MEGQRESELFAEETGAGDVHRHSARSRHVDHDRLYFVHTKQGSLTVELPVGESTG
jgi:hypothetical protein